MMQAPSPAIAQPQVLSTDDIQKLLEENYVFIKAVVEQQNLGRVQEMQQYQHKLQQNLMLLAAVADAQPHSPAPPVASIAPSLSMQSIPAGLQGLSLQGMGQSLPASASSLPLYSLPQQQLLQLQAQQQAQLNSSSSSLSQPAISSLVAAGGLLQQQQQQQTQQQQPQQLSLQQQQQQLYAASQQMQATQPQAFS